MGWGRLGSDDAVNSDAQPHARFIGSFQFSSFFTPGTMSKVGFKIAFPYVGDQ
jgi:hypothetical protein